MARAIGPYRMRRGEFSVDTTANDVWQRCRALEQALREQRALTAAALKRVELAEEQVRRAYRLAVHGLPPRRDR